MSKHTPTRMGYTGEFNRKQGGRTGGRMFNVWYHGYRCPVCGARCSRPRNPFKGRKVADPVCDGITYDDMGRRVKRPAIIKATDPGQRC